MEKLWKAQGAEFTLVYIMPVQDTGKEPWGQKKELINVAVSRAQEELCVITSASWMPPELQKQLLGYVANTGNTDREGLYVSKLLEYVYEEQNRRTVGENFGFRRTSIHSAFDRVLDWRQRNFHDEKEQTGPDGNPSAPECCMMEALESLEKSGQYKVYREFPLKGVEGIVAETPKLQNYIDDGARFDFIICKDDRVYAIIEVDGGYHRIGNADIEKNDGLKDDAVRSLGSAFSGRYFRFPTDGTTRDEKESIMNSLASVEENGKDLPTIRSDDRERDTVEGMLSYWREQEAVIQYLNDLLSRCWADLRAELEIQGYDEIVKGLSFEGEKLPVYKNKGQAAFYILKYANFNTLEYALMYQLALSMLKEEKYAAVYSFGCGPGFDGLSLVYAWSKLKKEVPDFGVKALTYRGVDIAEWPYLIQPGDLALDTVQSQYFHHGMTEFMTSMKTFHGNIFFFPKVLSEVSEKYVDGFCEQLKNANLISERMILCISYRNRYTAEDDWDKVKKIIKTMEDKGYTASKETPPEFHEMDWTEYFEVFCKDNYPCFAAKNIEVNENIYKLYNELRIPKDIERYLWRDIREACPKYPALKADYTGDSVYPNCVCEEMGCPDSEHCRTSPRKKFFSENGTGACFQVLLLKKQ